MNRPSWLVANFIIFLLLFILAMALQTSLLHWVFSWKASVQFILLLTVYICLYRKPAEAWLFVLLTGYMSGLLSTMLESLSVFTVMCVFVGLRTIRTRVYSPGHVYYTWTALGSVFAFHIISWITSVFFEPKPPRPHPLDWFLEVLLTALFTRVTFAVCQWVDRKTKRISITELNT